MGSLGVHASTFALPVDLREVPDYCDIIETPSDLGTVRQRILAGVYLSPQEVEQVEMNSAQSLLYRLNLELHLGKYMLNQTDQKNHHHK